MQIRRWVKKQMCSVRLMLREANIFLLLPLAGIGPIVILISGILCAKNGYSYYICRPAYMLPWPLLLLCSAAFSLFTGAFLGAQRTHGNSMRKLCMYRVYLLWILKLVFVLVTAPLVLCFYLPFFAILSVCMIGFLHALIWYEIKDIFACPPGIIVCLLCWIFYLFLCILGITILN